MIDKMKLNRKYGMEISEDLKITLREVFHSGNTHAVYTDTDSVHIVSKDSTLCMYDHAEELLK